jgi:hypothetical protein
MWVERRKESGSFAAPQNFECLNLYCRTSAAFAIEILMQTRECEVHRGHAAPVQQDMRTTDIAIECHDGYVPEWVEAELNRLYGSIYSSLAHFRLFGGLENAYTYVARQGEGGQIVALLLFRLEQDRVVVLNEGMLLEAEEVERFSAYLFQRFGSIGVVEFHAVHAPISKFPYPCQRFYQTEDFILQLPDTTDGYLALLGSATRKNLKKHLSRWQRDFPEAECQVYERDQIEEALLREVVVLNHMRMAAKNKVSAIDEAELNTMLQLARECGLLQVTRVQGRICAGTLMYRFGDHFVSRISAHDPQYDDHRLGTLACYWAVCESIRLGGTDFHFMWGRYAYKSALGGVLVELDHIAVYRSYWHMLVKAKLATSNAYSGYQREARMWLMAQSGKSSGMVPRLVHTCLNTAKAVRRMRQDRAPG